MAALSNPLATPEQLAQSGSLLDGIPSDLQDSIRFAAARLTQLAGVLLRLPQDIIAQAIVLFTRFWVGAEGGSLADCAAKDVSAAALYLAAKLSAYPRPPRSVLNVYAYLDAFPATLGDAAQYGTLPDPTAYHLSEGDYHALRSLLMRNEARLLRTLGFQTHVALPHALCVSYLQALGVVPGGKVGQVLAARALAHLNAALLSPQLLYITHQPPALATAAIYLAAREVGVKLPADEWWEVFDTDREELGFLVVAFMSLPTFAREEKAKWGAGKVPLTLPEVEAELEKRRIAREE